MAERTIPRLFEDSVAKFADNVLMWEKRNQKYEGTTYKEIQKSVYLFAAGLMATGFKKGDRIALIAEGRNDWVISELAILYCGAINVPVSIKIQELSDLKFRLAHSGSRAAIVSASQAPKIERIKNDLPDLDWIIHLDPKDAYEEDELSREAIIDRGREFLESDGEAFQQAWQSLKETDYANICYTSGTTADPKGIILSHLNYTANVEQSSSVMDVPSYYVSLLILPWDHAFAHTAGIYTLMRNGAAMASIQIGKTAMETLKNIPVNIKETRPHVLLSVPALAKSFRKNIEKGVREKGTKVENLFNRALKLAYKYNAEGWNRAKGLRKIYTPLYKLYDKILFSKIRENFGGRLEFFVGGGALLDIDLQRFFYALGMPMLQGYGLSEAAPVISANSLKAHKLGSSGKIVKDLEVKIVDEQNNEMPVGEKGEIIVKGENVMIGYWKNEEATKSTIRDGWLYTGDLGYLDEDGYLYVLGRTKSLLISNDGEKYSPEGIEETIAEQSKYIEQLMLYNDQSPFTVALLVPNKIAILEWLRKNDLTCHSKEGQEAALKLLQSEIDAYREGGKYADLFPSRWLPTSIAVLGEAFTEDNHFLNSTLKMVRGRIVEFYQNRIDFLFTTEGKNIINHQNMTIISRLEKGGE